MSKGQVRSVTLRSAPRRQQVAWLDIRDVTFEVTAPWHSDASLMQPMLQSLADALPTLESASVKNVRDRRPTTVASWNELGEVLRAGGTGVYEAEAIGAAVSTSLTINLTDVSFTLDVQIPCADHAFGEMRGQLESLLTLLHERYCGRALVGPSLSITPRNAPYVRPKPLREHPHWPAGAVTLAACRRLFASKGSEKLWRYEMLQSRAMPKGLNRRMSGDLLIIATDAHAGVDLATQRALLEQWISGVLQLPLDDDFDERGDRRLTIWERQNVGRLGFYDPASRFLYKSAPELKDDELDPGTLTVLQEVLATEELPDQRPVLGKCVVFVQRPAAVRWSRWIGERGGTVAYLGPDGQLWEPAREASKP